MVLRSTSTYATLITGAFIFLAMLLVNLVLSAFWYQEVKHLRRVHMEDMLAYAAASLDLRRLDGKSPSLPLLPRKGPFCLSLFSPAGKMLATNCPGSRSAQTAPQKSAALTRSVSLAGSKDRGLLSISEKPEAASLGRRMMRSQLYTFLYIFINTITLTLLACFCYARRIQKPLENLVATAESVRDHDPHFFSEQQDINELHQLSFSLNEMLRRLEQDRNALADAASKLACKNKQLEESQQEMLRTEKLAATGRLAAGLAHEIGNPLGVVQGYLELLQMDECQAEERRSYARNALQETQRINRLVSTLLQAARNRPAGQPERIDINAFLSDFAEAMQPQAVLKHISLRLNVQADHPVVEVVSDSLRQILLNALLNAADAIHMAKREDGRIELGARQIKRAHAPWLDIWIADNGCGLAPELAGKIFDPFFTTKEPGSGTGLGLSVSLSLAESMGGGMEAVNLEGGGMALHLFLPLAREDKNREGERA